MTSQRWSTLVSVSVFALVLATASDLLICEQCNVRGVRLIGSRG
jgi:hypothetical protein